MRKSLPIITYRNDISRDEALIHYFGEEAWTDSDNPIVDQFGQEEYLVTFPIFNDEIIEGEIVGWIREIYLNNQFYKMIIED